MASNGEKNECSYRFRKLRIKGKKGDFFKGFLRDKGFLARYAKLDEERKMLK